MYVEKWKMYSHRDLCKCFIFQHTFSQLILHLKCWNFVELESKGVSSSAGIRFNLDLFEFSAAIFEKDLLTSWRKARENWSNLTASGNISPRTLYCNEICLRGKLRPEAVLRSEILYLSNQGNLIFIRKKSGSI